MSSECSQCVSWGCLCFLVGAKKPGQPAARFLVDGVWQIEERQFCTTHIAPLSQSVSMYSQMAMLGLGTVLQRPSTSSNISTQTFSPRAPRRLACRVQPCAALVTDTPRPKIIGNSNGNGTVGQNGPTIIDGQVRSSACGLPPG